MIQINTVPPRFYMAGNPILIEAENDNPLLDFITLEIRKAGSLLATEKLPKISNKATFNVAAYCMANLSHKLTSQYETSAIVATDSNAYADFSITARDTQNNDAASLQIDVLAGGYPRQMQNMLERAESNFAQEHGNSKLFLSWQPLEKNVLPEQHESLFFLQPQTSPKTMYVNADIYYTDGAVETKQVILLGSPYQDGLREIRTSYWLLKEKNVFNPAKTVSKYYVYVADDQNSFQYTQRQCYVVNYDSSRRYRTFRFLNSFGTWDTYTFMGISSNTTDYSREMYAKASQNILTGTGTGNILQQKVMETESVTVNSGLVDKETKDWLRELLLSPEVYEVINDVYVPIVVTNNQAFQYEQESPLALLVLQYRYAYDNEYYAAGFTRFSETPWILEQGIWNDAGIWKDNAIWQTV